MIKLGRTLSAILLILLAASAFAVNLAFALPQLTVTTKAEKGTYYLRENVNVLGNVTFNDLLVDQGFAAVQVDSPLRTIVTRTRPTGPIGSQNFDMQIISVSLSDINGVPKQSVIRGATAYFRVQVKNNGIAAHTVTITANIFDNASNPMGLISRQNVEVYAGATFDFWDRVDLETWAANGTGTVYANVFSDWPANYGYPMCPEKASTFLILESEYDETHLGQVPQQPIQNGTYSVNFKLPPDPTKGVYIIYATAWYQGFTAPPAIATFTVSDIADFGNQDTSTAISSNIQNSIHGSVFTPDKSGTVYLVGAYVSMTGGNIQAAVYRTSDGKRIAYSNSKPGPSNGVYTWTWITLDFNGTIRAGTQYLVAVWADSACNLGGKTDASNPGRSKAVTYGAWPDPLTSLTTDNHLHDIYAEYKVKAPPRASFVARPPRAGPGYSILFDASSATAEGYGDTILSYQWNFGDTQTGTGKTVYHSYTTLGDRTVTLNVTDNEGFWNTTTRIVNIAIIPDVAVTNVTCLSDVYNNWIVQVPVTVKNEGTVTETFNVTLYANSTYSGKVKVTNLGPLATTTVNIAWNTTGLVLLNHYVLQAVADTVVNETNTANNQMTSNPVFVRLLGDARYDRKIDVLDLVVITSIYGSKSTDTNWNIMADLNPDGKIDILDVVKVTSIYGQRY